MMLFNMIDRIKNLLKESDVTRKCFMSVSWVMMMCFVWEEELKKKEIKKKELKKRNKKKK